MLKTTTFALIVALSSGVAMAQTTPAAPAGAGAMNGKFVTEQSAGEFRASKFVGLNVYGADNEKIGSINEILVDATGSAKAVVIGVGGFLGLGEKNVAVPFASLEWANAPDAARMPPAASNVGGAATPPVTTGAAPGVTGSTAPARSPAETAAYNGYPDHAVLRMTKADLQSAPDFKYYAQTQSNATAPKP
jgi:sporulation protein YlmC with PRC-barrel domain